MCERKYMFGDKSTVGSYAKKFNNNFVLFYIQQVLLIYFFLYFTILLNIC